jgi:hypothetical protein
VAKAQITTPQGISVRIEGTPAEIASVVDDLRKKHRDDSSAKPTRANTKTARPTLTNLVESLIDGGFFKKPQGLAGIRSALAEMGHHYPVTTLSGAMLNLVRTRQLRRIKSNKVWTYAR